MIGKHNRSVSSRYDGWQPLPTCATATEVKLHAVVGRADSGYGAARAMGTGTGKEQLSKYEAWAAKLEANILEMARQRRWSWAYLGGGAIAMAAVWRFHHFLAGALLTLGVILWITAIYITYMRTWFYKNELTRTRDEIDRLCAAPASRGEHSPTALP